jgi:predicted dehydrogenase
MNWGIIGCGRISRRFMEGLRQVENTSSVSVWSRRPESVAAFTSLYGGTACASLQQLLASDVDAVYVATLPDSHAFYSKAALQAGKHVLCEKPSTVNLLELNEVLALAKSKKLLFMEGMKPPFYPLYQRLKEHLIGDPIGPVGYLRAGSSVVDCPPEHPNFNLGLVGGSLMQIGIYEAWLALEWLGPFYDVQAMARFGKTGIDLFSIFQSRHESGFAQVYCGLDLHGPGDALLVGPLGHVIIHKNWWNPVKATIYYAGGRIIELHEPYVAGGLNYEIAHFCDLVKNGKTESPVMSHDMSRQMINLVDKARAVIGLKYPSEI